MMQQRPVMSRTELRSEIENAVSDLVPGTLHSGPNLSILSKAAFTVDEIMAAIDKYNLGRR